MFDRPDADADGLGLAFTLGNAVVYAGYVLGTGRIVGCGSGEEQSAREVDGVVASAYSFTGSLLFASALLPIAGLRMPPDRRWSRGSRWCGR